MAQPSFALAHVAIAVNDMAAAAEFYAMLGGRRGFARTDSEGRPELVQMAFGDRFVELIATRQAAQRETVAHLALGTTDIHAAWHFLCEQGFPPLDRPRTGASGVLWFFVIDPCGNRVEVTSPCDPE